MYFNTKPLLSPIYTILTRTKLDAIAFALGAIFLRPFKKDFHPMERPLVVVALAEGEPVAIDNPCHLSPQHSPEMTSL